MIFKLDYYTEGIRWKMAEEIELFKEIKNDWDWYDVPSSLFGFDIFPKLYYSPLFKKCPLNKEQQDNLTQTFSNIIKSNFNIIYNATGMDLVNKNFKSDLVRVLNNN